MLKKILYLYPNLQIAYNNVEDKNKFENFILNEFAIEKKSLDQILKKICYPASCKSENYPLPKKMSKINKKIK